MDKFIRFIPSSKIINIFVICLCLWECWCFYQTGYEQGSKRYEETHKISLSSADKCLRDISDCNIKLEKCSKFNYKIMDECRLERWNTASVFQAVPNE